MRTETPFDLLAALLAAASVPAQTADAALRLLTAMDHARLGAGGVDRTRAEFSGHYDLVVGGPKELKLAGPFSIWFDGDRAAEQIDYPEWGVMRRAYGPELTWEDHPAFGASVRRGAEADVVRRCLELVRYRGWRELYQRAEHTGEDSIDGTPVDVLRMSPAAGTPDVWYLDRETHLPVRIDIDLGGAMGVAQISYADWRPVDGVLYAHSEKTVAGSATGVFRYGNIRHGPEIDAAVFAVPEKVTELAAKSSAELQGARIDLVPEQPTAVVRMTVTPADIAKELAVALPQVMLYLTEAKAEIAGPPFARYFGMADGKLTMEAGMPVRAAVPGNEKIVASTLPKGRVATCYHIGPYHDLKATYDKLDAWMRDQHLESAGAPWEVYVTDPGLEPEPSKWRTQIFHPLK